ncbi:MAG: MFS transporter [Bacteroidota bacterium]|nr:MFS transporter [Bacteroidota bacterium]
MNKRLLVLLFFGVLMGALDIAILGPAMPAIQKAFAVSPRQIAWVINIYVLTNILSTPVLSKLSDLYGRRIIYISSVFLFALGSLVIVLSGQFDQVLVGRGIQGLGAGGFLPVASAVIGDTFPKEKQGRALGFIGAVFGLAFIVGPVIGGLLLMLSWHWIFILNLPMSVALIIGALTIVPSKQMEENVKFDWLGMSLLLVILGLFSFSINMIDTKNFVASVSSVRVFPLLTVSLGLLPLFIMSQKKSGSPTINTGLFRSRQLIIAYLISFGAGLGEVGVMFIPGYVRSAFGLSDSAASFSLIPLVAALFVGAPVAGRMLDKFGARIILILGTVLVFFGLVGIWKVADTKTGFYISEVILGTGLAAVLGAPLRYIVNHETSDDDRASGQGVLTIFMSIGQLVSAALVGALAASLGGGIPGFKGAFSVLAAMSLIMIVAATRLNRKEVKVSVKSS